MNSEFINRSIWVLISLIAIIAVVISSCNKEEPLLFDQNKQGNIGESLKVSDPMDTDDELILGDKLENPYSLENMNKAYSSLKSKNSNIRDYIIEPNYLYVRILPKTDLEYNIINNDTSMDLYEYPLDYKIKKQGNKYKDKSITDNNYTW